MCEPIDSSLPDNRQHGLLNQNFPRISFKRKCKYNLFTHEAPKSSKNSFKAVCTFQVELEFGNVNLNFHTAAQAFVGHAIVFFSFDTFFSEYRESAHILH